ncbi:hypothetical protein GCM10026987_34140 [Belliella aquatica]|uniref:cAMP-binding domain of CRP or a regulatory subunit of cAMP-dependent protein kinases n=2 Tax=Belliella aquatica TaxID=1323734 RepID=A0ABQ1LYW1_9BACT|nr:hypothetical protein GCM10010993_08010 [Belliella aquatica]
MKEDLDSLLVIDRKEYIKLFQFLKIKSYRKGEVLKSHEELEMVSRYIFSGDIAEYEYRDKKLYCRKIFSAQETACDFESYWSEEKSNITLKAFTDVQVGELHKADEFNVIEYIPVFAKLALKINHRMTKIDQQWKRLHYMEKKDAYNSLQKICRVFGLLQVLEISAILNIPERSVFRIRKELSQE